MRKPTPFLTSTDTAQPMMDINTTPLIDVMLVLLIMLILAMPLMTHAIKIDLPHGPQGEATRERVTLYVDFDSTLFWNDRVVSDVTELERIFRSEALQRSQPDIVVTANRHAKYDTIAQVLAAAQRNGVRHLGLVGND